MGCRDRDRDGDRVLLPWVQVLGSVCDVCPPASPRTESVAEKMLTNWFAFLLHRFLKVRRGGAGILLCSLTLQTPQQGETLPSGSKRWSGKEGKVEICSMLAAFPSLRSP